MAASNEIVLDGGVVLRLRRAGDAPGIFAAVERSREHLRSWLPWVDFTLSVDDVSARHARADALHARGELYEYVILERGTIVGKFDLHSVDRATGTARIGYWLASEAVGRGIVTAAVERITGVAFRELGVARLEIWTTAENVRSRAVAERAGYSPLPIEDGEDDAVRFFMTPERWSL